MDDRTEILLQDLCFAEGPRWHDERLWFSDMHEPAVKTVDLEGHAEVLFEVPGRPSGLGWLPDGRLLVVSMTDRKLLRLDPGGLTLHADLSALASGDCNDMVTDGAGRSYVGNFGFDFHDPQAENRPADLVLVSPRGEARVVARDLRFPNGSVITPDGRTLVVGESFGARLTAFDIQDDGTLTGRRLWAQLERAVPDGICLDAEEAIWVASPLGDEVLRVREGGAVTQRMRCSQNAIACMLGGPDGRHLMVCTSPTTEPEECRARRPARIEVARVDVPGAGWP